MSKIVSKDYDGRSIWWSEKTRNACYMLDFNLDEARWIYINLREYIYSNLAGSSFRRFRGSYAVFTLQSFKNKRGRFIELSKFNKQGKKFTTIIPSGVNAIGWIKLAKALDKLISGDYYRQKSQPRPRMFNQYKGSVQRQSYGEFISDSDDSNKQQIQKNWNEAIITTRGRATTSWKLIEEVLRKATISTIKLFPFQANKAIWWPLNAEQYTFYANLKKGYFDSQVYLEFDRWSKGINAILSSPLTTLGKSSGPVGSGLGKVDEEPCNIRDLSILNVGEDKEDFEQHVRGGGIDENVEDKEKPLKSRFKRELYRLHCGISYERGSTSRGPKFFR